MGVIVAPRGRLPDRDGHRRQGGHRRRLVGRRRAGQLPGHGQAVGGPHREQGQVHRVARPGRLPDDGGRLGHPARPRRPAGSGRDDPVRPGRRAEAARRGPRHRHLPRGHRSRTRGPRHGRRQDRRRLHEALGQGLHLVQHGELRRHGARDMGRRAWRSTPRPRTRCSASARVRADSGWPGTDWVEDFVIRSPAPTSTTSWVAGKTKWTDPAIKAAFEAFGEVLRVLVRWRRPTRTPRTSATVATSCSPTRPAASSTTRRASSARSSRTRRRRRRRVRLLRHAGDQLRSTPVPSPAAATCSGCSRTRRGREGPPEGTSSPPRRSRSGPTRAASSPPTPRSRRTRTRSSRSPPTPSMTRRSSGSTAAT